MPAFVLEVVGGEDHGARLVVEDAVRTIGQSRDADLVLRDLAVSRQHLQAAATESGLQIAVCGQAAPFVVEGQPVRTLLAQGGERVLVGNTILLVAREVLPKGIGDAALLARTDVRTLMTGIAADTRAIAAVHTLIEALDGARDRAALDTILQGWAAEHAFASRVAWLAEQPNSPENWAEVSERAEGGNGVVIAVPTTAEEPLRLELAARSRANG